LWYGFRYGDCFYRRIAGTKDHDWSNLDLRASIDLYDFATETCES
jgi:hypothetical protein